MHKFLKLMFLVGLVMIQGCSNANVKYEYPQNNSERESDNMGFLMSKPIYLVKPQENKQQ